MRTGYAHLPLHGGHAPPWLFRRMVPLSREIVAFIASEFGRDEVLHQALNKANVARTEKVHAFRRLAAFQK